jgi:phosphohistidine phosphatase SixA
VNGLKNARNTGRAMISTNLIADVCLSSTALRCIQTAERILTGKSEYQ